MRPSDSVLAARAVICGSVLQAKKNELKLAEEICSLGSERCELGLATIPADCESTFEPSTQLLEQLRAHQQKANALFATLHDLPRERFLIAIDSVLVLLIFDSPARQKKGLISL